MPGIGKTRMLHELIKILKQHFNDNSAVPKNQIELLITYNNGKGISEFDQYVEVI